MLTALLLQALTAVGSIVLATALLGSAPFRIRVTAAALAYVALPIGLVALLGSVGGHEYGALTPLVYRLMCCSVGVALLALALLPNVRTRLAADGRTVLAVGRALAHSPAEAVVCTLGAAVVVMAAVSAAVQPPWAWDALGYHLPIVHSALQTGRLESVPSSVSYVTAYPRLVEYGFIGWQLAFDDDRFIEAGQLVYVPLAWLATAALAREAGVGPSRALATGALWLTLPAVWLQLGTGYVDVAVAALALGAAALLAPRAFTWSAGVYAALALGLLLGSKPSAPPLTLLLAGILAYRAWSVFSVWRLTALLAAIPAIGGWKYWENVREHGNPLWPAKLEFWGVHLSGEASLGEIALNGLTESERALGWLPRLLLSWVTIPAHFTFDQRLGGFGPLYPLLLLPALTAALVACAASPNFRADATERLRSIALPLTVLTLGTLATPGAHWARYTLAVAAVFAVLCATAAEPLTHRWRATAGWLTACLSCCSVVMAYPALTGSPTTLHQLLPLSDLERAERLSLPEHGPSWEQARRRVRPGETFAHDDCVALPGRLFAPHTRGAVRYLGAPTPNLNLASQLESAGVRVAALGPDRAARFAGAANWRLLFSTHDEWERCTVFERR